MRRFQIDRHRLEAFCKRHHVTRLSVLDAALDAMAFVMERKREDLDTDRQLTLALIKCLEIVGEAANQTSDVTRAALPKMPWRDMIDMRHILVHG